MSLRFVAHPEYPGRTTPAYGDCDACRAHGTVMGGDQDRPCPACVLRLRREYGPFVDALAEIPTEEQRAREAAEDRADWSAKEAG